MGLKQTEPNPWDMISSKYRIGDRITGTVRNVTDFGAFVEVEEGIDGLVHISDMSWTRRIKHPSEVLNKGDEVEALILKIDSENQRLSLGVKQLLPNVLDDFFQTHNTGTVLTGKIVRLTEFGAFVELFEGVEGLVHVSELSTEHIEKPEDQFEVDQEVRVKVIKIDPVEKKIGLSIKAALGEPDSASIEPYAESGSRDGSATLGDLMDPSIFRTEDTTAETATEGEAETKETAAAETATEEKAVAEETTAKEAATEEEATAKETTTAKAATKDGEAKVTKKKTTKKTATKKKTAKKKTTTKKTKKKDDENA